MQTRMSVSHGAFQPCTVLDKSTAELELRLLE